jgi:serine/threonine protein kinase
MGVVYLAKYSNEPDKVFAIKKIYNTDFKEMNTSFKECLNGRIKHENLVYYDSVETSEEVVEGEKKYVITICMEYYDSGDLKGLILQKKNEGSYFTENQVVYYMKQLASGLKALHDNHIVHRDLKPQNVFMTNNSKTCKIGDFGLSKFVNGKFYF